MKLLKITLVVNAIVALFFGLLSAFYPTGMIENFQMTYSEDLAVMVRTSIPNTVGMALLMLAARKIESRSDLRIVIKVIIATWTIAGVTFLYLAFNNSAGLAPMIPTVVLAVVFVSIYGYCLGQLN